MFPREFTDNKNFLSPSPNWEYQPTNLPISTTAPLDESELGSMNFQLWKEIGQNFLIKNTVNNWITCSPNGGSLVDMVTGPISCNVTKIVVEGVCEDVVPFTFERHGTVAALFSPSGFYYNLYTNGENSWAVSDPCGTTRQNQLNGVVNPAGWFYLREDDKLDPVVAEIVDTKNNSRKYLSVICLGLLEKIETTFVLTYCCDLFNIL